MEETSMETLAEMRETSPDRSAELDRREREITRREVRAEAARLLSERKLPGELIDAVALGGIDEMRVSLDKAEEAFRRAVQAGVEERLKGSAPKAGRVYAAGEDVDDETYYRGVFGR